MKKRHIAIISFSVLAIVWMLFIWSNSMTVGSESGELSGSVTKWVNDIIQKVFPSVTLSHTFIRKFAHFSEFAVLSSILCFDIYYIFSFGRTSSLKKYFLLFLSTLISFAVASADEIIQLSVDGRVGAFTDVLIDTSGALFASLIFFAVVVLRRSIVEKSRN